jgi:hypothetical protein
MINNAFHAVRELVQSYEFDVDPPDGSWFPVRCDVYRENDGSFNVRVLRRALFEIDVLEESEKPHLRRFKSTQLMFVEQSYQYLGDDIRIVAPSAWDAFRLVHDDLLRYFGRRFGDAYFLVESIERDAAPAKVYRLDLWQSERDVTKYRIAVFRRQELAVEQVHLDYDESAPMDDRVRAYCFVDVTDEVSPELTSIVANDVAEARARMVSVNLPGC